MPYRLWQSFQPRHRYLLNVAKIRNIYLTCAAKADFNQTLTLGKLVDTKKSTPANKQLGKCCKIKPTHASLLPDLTLTKQALSCTRIYRVSQNLTPKSQFRTISARNAHDFALLYSYKSASYKTLAHDLRTISARLAHSHFLTQKIKTAYSQRVTFAVASEKFTKSAKIGKNSSSRAY